MALSVDRTQLIDEITAQREKIVAPLQAAVDDAQKALDDIEPIDSVAGWFRAVADLIDEGKVEASGHRSAADQYNQKRYRGVPAKNWFCLENSSLENGEPVWPDFPERNQPRIQALEQTLKAKQDKLEAAVKPFDAGLKVLNMSTDATVELEANFTKLLEG